MSFLIVFFGAGLGGALRHGVYLAAFKYLGPTAGFPYGTLVINIFGSFLIGLVTEYYSLKGGFPQDLRLFLVTGIIGGFTTFSAFSIEIATLCEKGQPVSALIYVLASILISMTVLFAAVALVRMLVSGPAV